MKTMSLLPEQLAALRTFADANGAQWKFNAAWSTGRYRDYPGTPAYGYLQQVRNVFGPLWLGSSSSRSTTSRPTA